MKKIFFVFLAGTLFALSTACVNNESHSVPDGISLSEQTLEQLGVCPTDERLKTDGRLNYEKQVGMWFTYMDYKNILKGKSESEFTQSIKAAFKNAAEMGVNTLYVHVRAFGDCYYKSDIFPKGEYFDGNYDPLEIMLVQAHNLGLSLHAWINPLRCQTEDEIKQLDDIYQIKKWYDSKEKNGTYIVKVGEHFCLDPAYPEVRRLIADGVKEIAQNYSVDGFHIDDYFYPTTDEAFDAAAFSMSDSSDLAGWRTENISKMVQEIYTAIKAEDEELLFGISPQGNVSANYNSQYADVNVWTSQPGFCDYIVPQIYFGFENESCPFEETVKRWQNMNTRNELKLVIGLCTYKIGNEDKWAGSGKNEWVENPDIVSRQAELCAEAGLGIAVYSYDSTFSDAISVQRKTLTKTIMENFGGENQ